MRTIGIIMNIDHETLKATVLTPEGDFITCRLDHAGYELGEEILFQEIAATSTQKAPQGVIPFERKSKNHFARKVTGLASAAVLMVGIAGSWFYPVSSLYFEVNPSFAIETNIYNRVIGIKSFNSDGAEMVKKLVINGEKLDVALAKTVKGLEAAGYLKEDDSAMIIGYDDQAQRGKVEAEVTKVVKAAAADAKVEPVVAVMAITDGVEALAEIKESSPVRVQIALSQEEEPSVEGLDQALKDMKEKKTKELIVKADKTRIKVVMPGVVKPKKQPVTDATTVDTPSTLNTPSTGTAVAADGKTQNKSPGANVVQNTTQKPDKKVVLDDAQSVKKDSNNVVKKPVDGNVDQTIESDGDNVTSGDDSIEEGGNIEGKETEKRAVEQFEKRLAAVEVAIDKMTNRVTKAKETAEANGNVKVLEKLSKIENELSIVQGQIDLLKDDTMGIKQRIKRFGLVLERIRKIESLWVGIHVTK